MAAVSYVLRSDGASGNQSLTLIKVYPCAIAAGEGGHTQTKRETALSRRDHR